MNNGQKEKFKELCFIKGKENLNFFGAKFKIDADFSGLNLEGVNFREATVIGGNFYNTNLKGANFQDANIEEAFFDYADLRATNFNVKVFRNASFRRAKIDSFTKLPKGINPKQEEISPPL